MFKKIAANTLSQILGKIGTLLFSLLTTSLLAQSLGVEGYGQYTFITALVLLFGTTSDWGTQIITVREASKQKDKQNEIFGTAIILRLALALVSFSVLNLLVRFNSSWANLSTPITIASFILFFVSVKTSLGAIFQTFFKLGKAAVLEVFLALIFLLLVFVSLKSNLGLSGVMVSWIVATSLSVFLGFYFVSKITTISWKFNKQVAKSLLWESFPAGALFLFFNIYDRLDILVLEHFKGLEIVGIYGLPYKIYGNLTMGAAFLMNSLFPVFSEEFSKKGDKKTLQNYYQKTFDVIFASGLVVSFVFFALAPIIIFLLGGKNYMESVGLLRILIFANIISYVNHLTGFSLIAFGKQKSSLLIATAALIFNAVTNWVLVPIFSFYASAVLTVATEGLVLVLSMVVVWKTIGIVPSPLLFPKTVCGFLKEKFETRKTI